MNFNSFSVITVTKRENCINQIISNYTRQVVSNKELIIIINNDSLNISQYNNLISKLNNIHIYKLPQSTTLGECLNFGVKHSKNNIISKFDDDDYYGPLYLQEVETIFSNIKCDIVGKSKVYMYFERFHELRVKHIGLENEFTNKVMGSTLCFKRTVFDYVSFRKINLQEDKWFNVDCIKNNYKIYSSSSYNHIVFKHLNNDEHTFKSNLNFLRETSHLIKENTSFEECFNLVNKSKPFNIIL